MTNLKTHATCIPKVEEKNDSAGIQWRAATPNERAGKVYASTNVRCVRARGCDAAENCKV